MGFERLYLVPLPNWPFVSIPLAVPIFGWASTAVLVLRCVHGRLVLRLQPTAAERAARD
jgi:hypothetical protein